MVSAGPWPCSRHSEAKSFAASTACVRRSLRILAFAKKLFLSRSSAMDWIACRPGHSVNHPCFQCRRARIRGRKTHTAFTCFFSPATW